MRKRHNEAAFAALGLAVPPVVPNPGLCSKGHPKDRNGLIKRPNEGGGFTLQRKYWCRECNVANVKRSYAGCSNVTISKMLLADIAANGEGRSVRREVGRLLVLALELERSKKLHPKREPGHNSG